MNTCCYRCPKRLVTSEWNCHDHCEEYIAQAEEAAYYRKLRDESGRLYAQRSESVQKMKKKWRRSDGKISE